MSLKQIFAITAALSVSGCAADQLSKNSLQTINTFGSVEQRLVLANLSRYIDDPWTVPSHADFTSGVFQSSTSVALSGKFPLMNLGSQTREIDVAMASSGDTDNWTLTPVTDSQDLRRLRAVYSYAVCGDERELYRAFNQSIGNVEPRIMQRRKFSNTKIRAAWSAWYDFDASPKINAPAILGPVVGGDAKPKSMPRNTPAQTKRAAPSPPKNSGASSSNAPASSNLTASYFSKILWMLPRERWLFWSGSPRGQLLNEPGCVYRADDGVPENAVSLGRYGEHELWTTNRKAFSDFVFTVLSALPNTVGYPASVYPDGGGLQPPPKTALANPYGRFGTLR